MKSKWIFQKLNHHLPATPSSLTHPFKILISSHASPETASFFFNHADVSRLLSDCGRKGNVLLGSSLHASIIKHFGFADLENHISLRNVAVVWNSLIHMYLRCGVLPDARRLFEHMPVKDTISWNTMIAGLLRTGDFERGFGYFKKMYGLNTYLFDQATLTAMLSACDGPDFLYVSKMIHGLVFVNGYEGEMTVGNALVTSYFKCGCISSGRQVFNELPERNVITWTAIISGLVQNQFYEESLKLFVKMRCAPAIPNFLTYLSLLSACSGLQALKDGQQVHGALWKLGIQSDLCIESALMDMYSKCGCIEDAWQIFESTEVLDEVSLTVILVGFAQNGYDDEAIQIFVKMVKAGIEIDPNMVSAVLGVFNGDTSLALGRQIHSLIIKKGFCSNPFINNGLINMYAKCGDFEESVEIFDRMPYRNSISWNSMIAAFARHGNGSKALHLFEEMKLEGADPTDVTFLSLLHACSHVGLIDKGLGFLDSMDKVYGINPRMEHYASVVDMLGRAGLLNEAKSFIEQLPVKPGVLIWQAFLGACSIHGDSEMGKYAADQLYLMAPDSPATYILMANIYSSKGLWQDRANTIKRMKKLGVAKERGISWIEIEKKIHSFVVEDHMHPQTEIIYGVLFELFRHMSDEGYVPDKQFILFYLDQNGSQRQKV